MDAFLSAITAAAGEAAARCVVITGAGRGFCAGGDTKDVSFGQPRPPEDVAGARLRRLAEASRLLREMPKPTIAMINGPVAGAGIGVVGACDFRFAATSATFASSYP